MLLGETDYQKALEFVAGRKDMNRYRSMVDFIFAEIWLQWKPKCFAYYELGGEKRLLKNFITEEERASYERWMVSALKHAKTKLDEKRRESWKSFRIEVLRLAA